MRYKKMKKFVNDEEYYSYLREKRNVNSVVHYETPILKNPTISDRMSLVTQQHIWKYGDRLYNLAHQYYGNVSYWWVIAWYNGVAMESEIFNGDLIDIPLDLRETLKVLGV